MDTVNSGSKIQFPTGTNMKEHYGVYMGADYNNANTYAQTPMTGSFVYGKIYIKALTDDEVLSKYNELSLRKSLTKIDELNIILTETLPNKKAEVENTEKIDSFINDGWLLMGNTNLTDTDIEIFIDEVNTYLSSLITSAKAETTEAVIAKYIDGDIVIDGQILNIEDNVIKVGDRAAKVYKTTITAGSKAISGGSISATIEDNTVTNSFKETIDPHGQSFIYSVLSQVDDNSWINPQWAYTLNEVK